MSAIWWVRHGPTHAKTISGWTDHKADLSDAEAIARLSAALPADAVVVSSDLSRAVDTADAIAGGRRRLAPLPALREFNFGAWEDRAFAEIAAEDPVAVRAFWDRPGETRPPGGESWNDLRARVDAAADALLAEHGGQDIVAVAHYGVILCQVQRARGITPKEALAQRIETLSVTRLRAASPWEAELVNHRP